LSIDNSIYLTVNYSGLGLKETGQRHEGVSYNAVGKASSRFYERFKKDRKLNLKIKKILSNVQMRPLIFFTKRNLMVLLYVFFLVFFGCTEYKEEPPFFDGLFLEYNLGGPFRVSYAVKNFKDDGYKIIETYKGGVLNGETEEMWVNVYGRVYKSTNKNYERTFSHIWIPVNKMEIGDSFKYLGDEYTVARIGKWKKWEVMVIKNLDYGYERYYEVNTGYWVGSSGERGKKIILTNTNADIPTIEE
jgi:hypothetical protein